MHMVARFPFTKTGLSNRKLHYENMHTDHRLMTSNQPGKRIGPRACMHARSAVPYPYVTRNDGPAGRPVERESQSYY
jgi:hypothetical protein